MNEKFEGECALNDNLNTPHSGIIKKNYIIFYTSCNTLFRTAEKTVRDCLLDFLRHRMRAELRVFEDIS